MSGHTSRLSLNFLRKKTQPDSLLDGDVTVEKFTKLTYSTPEDPWISSFLIQLVEFLTGRFPLERKFNQVLNSNKTPSLIWQELVEACGLKLNYDPKQLAKIPVNEPVIFIANHPFGVVDGMVMAFLAAQKFPKFKLLVNGVLCTDELLNNFFLPIDFGSNKKALQTNIQTRTLAIEKIKSGEPIVIFPAGGVATAPSCWKKAEDLEWKRFVVKLIHKAEATVIPIYFHGQNSRLFQMVSQFSQDLRLALLLFEVRNKMHKTLKIEIGNPITFKEMNSQTKKNDLLNFLYHQVFSLNKT
ncbi:lysophospholipid acyltransferase family protein [Flexithrix dorotheae]|uniref:lysophospholipid acyltransferase family protein n=1 Tax=Flexithrix dorotheae TaxID=70993 RepID=UPI00035D0896|nr:lysophospholipid acyltransferase family protein [Flexithrix dorotheae]